MAGHSWFALGFLVGVLFVGSLMIHILGTVVREIKQEQLEQRDRENGNAPPQCTA